jgi:hypothetical protein
LSLAVIAQSPNTRAITDALRIDRSQCLPGGEQHYPEVPHGLWRSWYLNYRRVADGSVPTCEERTWKRITDRKWPLASDTTLLIAFSLLLQNISMSDPSLPSFSRTTAKSLETSYWSSRKDGREHRGSQLIAGSGTRAIHDKEEDGSSGFYHSGCRRSWLSWSLPAVKMF